MSRRIAEKWRTALFHIKPVDKFPAKIYSIGDGTSIEGLFRIRLQADFVGRTSEARLRKNGKFLNADEKTSRRASARRASARRVALAA